MHLVCGKCQRPLTRDCRLGGADEHNPYAGDRVPAVQPRVIVRLADEVVDDARYLNIPFASAAYALNPADALPRALQLSGIDTGCCGSSGSDGPNRSCQCGHVVGTEFSDCWTQAEIVFDPAAVTLKD